MLFNLSTLLRPNLGCDIEDVSSVIFVSVCMNFAIFLNEGSLIESILIGKIISFANSLLHSIEYIR